MYTNIATSRGKQKLYHPYRKARLLIWICGCEKALPLCITRHRHTACLHTEYILLSTLWEHQCLCKLALRNQAGNQTGTQISLTREKPIVVTVRSRLMQPFMALNTLSSEERKSPMFAGNMSINTHSECQVLGVFVLTAMFTRE